MDQESEGVKALEDLWQRVVDHLKEEIPEESIETWIRPIKASFQRPGVVTLKVPNRFYQGWITENYEDIIKNKMRQLWNREVQLTYTVEEKEEHHETSKEKTSSNFQIPKLNPRYSFQTFVVGTGNQFAHAASLAVAKEPGRVYNPLFIYGGVGLGKTHLLHAIGHTILERDPFTQVIYISAEQFMNELIDNIRFDRMASFRNKFRKAKVLLIDDIQFIAGKDRTQEEFFHTFNELHESNSQIVISSDRFPGEMERLEERLKSRFQWGLIADIQPPDLETRVAILRKKAEIEGIPIPQEVALFIAKRVRSNVRELEGCLIRLGALSSIIGKPITLDMARKTLEDLFPASMEDITVEKIQRIVCEQFKIKLSDLKSKRRSRNIVLPRQVAMYLARKFTQSSLPELGESFGGKDHTSVLHSIRKVKRTLESDEELRKIVKNLEETIEGQ